MGSEHDYRRAIDALMNPHLDYRAIVVEFAKMYPAEFCKIAGGTTTALDDEILALYKSGRKVEAIKYHRATTGSNLKEAKDYCDALFERACGSASLTSSFVHAEAKSW